MQATSGNVLKITVHSDKLDKKECREIIKSINALLNSNGGTLELYHEKNLTVKEVDNFVRTIEQKITDSIGIVTMTTNIKCKLVSPPAPKIIFTVRSNDCLSILNYNLFLPTKYQVNVIPPSESPDKVRRMLEKLQSTTKTETCLKSYNQDFALNQNAAVDEDVNVQCKSLKSEGSKCVHLADRIANKSNKLTCYVSGFANHIGGHIYYGINDDRVVKGQKVEDDEVEGITSKVEKAICKMIWPEHCGAPKRGKQWDIFFEPVKDAKGKPVPSTYVIVIAVACCAGGVFAEEPESYHISGDGKVVRMGFKDWMQHFMSGLSTNRQLEVVPSPVPRIPWSSQKNKMVFQSVKSALVQVRNNETMDYFEKCSELAVSMFPGTCASNVVAAEKVSVAIKAQHYRKAEKLLLDFSKLIPFCQDPQVFVLLELYLRSRCQRSMGEYDKSYKSAQLGLQQMQSMEAGVLTVWFHIHASAVAFILASKDGQDFERCMDHSKKWLEMGSKDAYMLANDEITIDLKQKLHIYTAMFHLGITLTGHTVLRKLVTQEDINNAESSLASFQKSSGKASCFRESQFKLAQSDLHYRWSCLSSQMESAKLLKSAFQCANEAKYLAKQHRFEEVVDYASNRIARLTEELLRCNSLLSFQKRDCD